MQTNNRHSTVSHWRFGDPAQVASALSAALHNVGGLGFEQSQGLFHHVQTILSLGDWTFARYRSTGFRFSATQGSDFHLAFVLRGGVAMHARGSEISVRPFAAGGVVGPMEPFSADVSPGTITHTIDMPYALLRNQAEALFGQGVDATCGLCSVDLQSDAGSALVRNAHSIFNEIVSLEGRLSSLAIPSFTELLANLILVTAFPSIRSRLECEAPDPGPDAVKRARQYLDDCALEPLRIADLAKATGVSVRSLQRGFRQHLSCSPLQYLLMRRLDLAHERLASPIPGDTVTTVATECGFMNLSKFAWRYRARYGVLPSDTLKRGKGIR